MTKQSYFDALAACDVVLSLSTQESFGVAVVEAMALGLPPVLPCLPAYRELMHGTERFLFEDVTQIPDLVRAAVEHRLEIGPMVRGLAERFAPAAFAARVRSALDGFFQGGVS
jgi:glycosyltransferase involved in cell wall biosynthesis